MPVSVMTTTGQQIRGPHIRIRLPPGLYLRRTVVGAPREVSAVLQRHRLEGCGLWCPLAQTRPPLPTAGSAMDGGGGANRSGNNDAARRRRFDKSAVAGQGQGDTSVQCLVPPGERNGAMVALLGPRRGTMVVRRPPTLLREVWRPDGACLICDNGNW
jgi:hypothetical protein